VDCGLPSCSFCEDILLLNSQNFNAIGIRANFNAIRDNREAILGNRKAIDEINNKQQIRLGC